MAKYKKSFDEESEYYTQVNMVTCRNRSSQMKFFIKSHKMLSYVAQMLSYVAGNFIMLNKERKKYK